MTQRAQRAPRLFVLKRNDAKGAENAKVFIVILNRRGAEAQRREVFGVRDQGSEGSRQKEGLTLNLEL